MHGAEMADESSLETSSGDEHRVEETDENKGDEKSRVTNKERGYQVCGVRNRQRKPCQRVGVCPFHGTRTPLNIPGDDYERDRHTINYEIHAESELKIKAITGEPETHPMKRKRDDGKNAWPRQFSPQYTGNFPGQTRLVSPYANLSPRAIENSQRFLGIRDQTPYVAPQQQVPVVPAPLPYVHHPTSPSPLFRPLSPHFYHPQSPPIVEEYRPFWVPPNYHGQIANRRYSSHPVLPSLPSKEELESMSKRPRSKTLEDFELSAEELRRRADIKESTETRGHLHRVVIESRQEEKVQEVKEEAKESPKEDKAAIDAITDPFERAMANHALKTYRKPETDSKSQPSVVLPKLSSLQGSPTLLPPLSQFPRPFFP